MTANSREIRNEKVQKKEGFIGKPKKKAMIIKKKN